MSTPFESDHVAKAAVLLSADRLSTFIRIAGSDRDAIALHHQSLLVAAALMPTMAMIEIVIRNAICERLRAAFGKPDWLTNPPAPFMWKGEELDNIRRCSGWARRAAYAKLSQAEKRALDVKAFPDGVPADVTHEARSKARQRHIEITNGQLIAQLTLFFWKRAFSSDYEETLWKRALRDLFPNKTVRRAEVAARLETIYQVRNRIAHHEPVMSARLDEVIAAIDFVVTNFLARTAGEDAILAQMTRNYRLTLAAEATKMTAMIRGFVIAPPADDGV